MITSNENKLHFPYVQKMLFLPLVLIAALSFAGCYSPNKLYDEGTVTTQNGDVFEIKSRSEITGRMYSIKDGDSLLLEVGDEEIRSSDFELIYDSDRVKAYLFYECYILVSVNNESFQLVDEDFAFDEVPEVDEMIAENLIRNEGTLYNYFDIFEQRQSEKCSALRREYREKNDSKLSEFGLPTASGPRKDVLDNLGEYLYG
ncbi:hypothetical protein [Ruminococcus albus]|uniref:Uncharacterized protein n=1 Tax=Ruminococcus albus TaxID=1264 RepID=A0A1H7FST3_RUMAL|nr:hypothetical protein [Ruminococcus albus]SEK28277.1 hypothetical protein SAMN05216469_101364 [Ruminococcus albus]